MGKDIELSVLVCPDLFGAYVTAINSRTLCDAPTQIITLLLLSDCNDYCRYIDANGIDFSSNV